MYDYFLGAILPWPILFEPEGWFFCDGRLLRVSYYQALYALLGNTYGGDGYNTFALPDLRGRMPLAASTNAPQGAIASQLGLTGGYPSINAASTLLPDATQDMTRAAYALPDAALNTAPPQLGLNFIICYNGYWPCRD